VENYTGADAQGVERPKDQALCVGSSIKVADFGCCTAKDVVDIVGSDASDLAKGIAADTKRFVSIGTNQADKPFDNAEETAYEVHVRIAVVTGEEAGGAVFTLFLGFECEQGAAY
jgi:hypothetical protein